MTDAVCRVVVMVPVPCQEGWFQVCGLVRVLLAGFWWRGSGGGVLVAERGRGRGGVMCDFYAAGDFDRRIHTSESHNASISHVISRQDRGRAVPAGAGVADAVTVPCA